jgi:hypothetical protein
VLVVLVSAAARASPATPHHRHSERAASAQ